MRKYFWRNFILIFSVAVISLGIQLGMLAIQYRSSRAEWVDNIYTQFVAKMDSSIEYSSEDGTELDALSNYIEALDDNRISTYSIMDSQGHELLTMKRHAETEMGLSQNFSEERPPEKPASERGTEPTGERPTGEMTPGERPAGDMPIANADEPGDYIGSFEIAVGENSTYTVGLYSYNPATYTYTKDLINSCIRSILISIPVCLVIAVVLSFLISRGNTSTVNEVRTALNDLASGKHSVELKRATKSEMEEIATDIQNLGKTLEANERGRKAWLTSISHDLSTPATGIKIITDGLSDGFFEADKQTIESLKHEADTLNDRISKVVDYSTLQNRKLSLSRVACRDFAQALASSFGKEFKISYGDGDLCADVPLMEKACRELLSNAFAFGCDVELSVGQEGENYFIKVLNTGALPSGVAGEVLFEPWARADSSRHGGGTGLGLSIVGTIAMLHGGKAEIYSFSDSKVCASILWPVK